ncbi:MAG TPA: cell division protein FtsA [Candidatus Pseudogracilibacillus intestinigallinarum]|uniref:Cell division protein FtsA n=1 Tax=Candidatus Pseudogracilibacillus intestinigallinarum TaxID=2838742 RepID=A0A9D1TJ71_9BACI|nr:cell division protein FtsA [Candidatus Pseudogracilibacillus intestinigallinarum]
MSNGEILVSLDIGTSEIKVIIGEVLNGSINIIGVGTAKSEGMRKGAIVDIDKTVQSIKNAIGQAEHMVDMKIEQVIVSVNGNHVQLHPCHGVVAVQSEDREITNEDVERVLDGAQVMSLPPEREIIDIIPKQFIVDGLDEISDPRGMIGVRLEMEGTIITCSKTVLHNVLRCVERAGLHIADICLQPIAAGSVALSSDEKNLGVALIDIGGGCTTVSIFENDHLKATSIIPLGGNNITKDISIGLRTTTEEAEEIKLTYGHAYYATASEEETFQATIIGSDQKETYNQLFISDMIEARLEEIFELVNQEIRRLGFYDIRGGYVLTGGTMKMQGALELAQEVFNANARIAIPNYIGVREPQFTVGVGTLQFSYYNAKIQGKNLSSGLTVDAPAQQSAPKPKRKVQQKSEPKSDEPKESKVANFFKSFFE